MAHNAINTTLNKNLVTGIKYTETSQFRAVSHRQFSEYYLVFVRPRLYPSKSSRIHDSLFIVFVIRHKNAI